MEENKMAKKGLGNGLDTMLGVHTTPSRNKSSAKSVETKEVIKEVIKEVPTEMTLKIKDIEINKDQPRKQFNEDQRLEWTVCSFGRKRGYVRRGEDIRKGSAQSGISYLNS